MEKFLSLSLLVFIIIFFASCEREPSSPKEENSSQVKTEKQPGVSSEISTEVPINKKESEDRKINDAGIKKPGEEKSVRCKEHIELLSAKEVAKEIGKTEMWVIKNFKINLWQKQTSQGKGRIVGEMLPGSRAVIIEKGKDDYKVKSPLDRSIGWVNKIQVKRTLFQDTETREPCKKIK